jgi:hypothetical protein
MLELIVNAAVSDDRIRAVIMNGSRTDPADPELASFAAQHGYEIGHDGLTI